MGSVGVEPDGNQFTPVGGVFGLRLRLFCNDDACGILLDDGVVLVVVVVTDITVVAVVVVGIPVVDIISLLFRA